jgi:hypothetical protein
MQLRPWLIALALALTPSMLVAQQDMSEQPMRHPAEGAPPPDDAAAAEAPATGATTEEAAPEEAAEATSEDTTDPMLTYMQQRMEEMISHWDAMNQTTDPAERQRLMLEHRQKMMALNAMVRNIAQPGRMGPGGGRMGGMRGQRGCPMMGKGSGPGGGMRGQGGCPMMGAGPGTGGGMRGCGRGLGMTGAGTDGDLREAFEQLEKRVDLLQSLIQGMPRDYR